MDSYKPNEKEESDAPQVILEDKPAGTSVRDPLLILDQLTLETPDAKSTLIQNLTLQVWVKKNFDGALWEQLECNIICLVSGNATDRTVNVKDPAVKETQLVHIGSSWGIPTDYGTQWSRKDFTLACNSGPLEIWIWPNHSIWNSCGQSSTGWEHHVYSSKAVPCTGKSAGSIAVPYMV